jgi:putative tryptophan/tyrosine transport system substrate-binding protein
VLMTSYRSRKPVISYSPAHVKSGALASIYSSPVDIGRHLSILMHESLNNAGVGPARPHFARFYTIALNSSVAGALGLTLPSEVQLRQRVDQLAR